MTTLTADEGSSEEYRTADEGSSEEYGDAEFIALMARLDVSLELAAPGPPSPPPRTPSPSPASQPVPALHTFPAMRGRTYRLTNRSTMYGVSSPTMEGYTDQWSSAGFATQGVAGSHVQIIQGGRSGNSGRKAAYVIFCGYQYGVFLTWAETKPLVSGVSNCIFRGYATVAEAQAAFDYAVERSWVRKCDSHVTAAIATLPRPTTFATAEHNPLNGATMTNNQWYIVYRGITPGVYRSHLECQLNTLGVSGALYESVKGYALAQSKFAAAMRQHNVEEFWSVYIPLFMIPPPLKSKHQAGPTDYELKQQRLDNRREKARLRMARKRAELKQRPLEEQQEAAERARLHQAAYRESSANRHRNDLRLWEAQRRVEMYKKRFGPEAYHAYAKLKRDRKRRAREKKRAKEGYYDEQQPRPPHHSTPHHSA
ncbi:hypothetical protein C8R43DRAFT_1143053 [Mycena crocata]|nr:hypothetical protein C8R43DRAFT_1143053 [Mycena crocata]